MERSDWVKSAVRRMHHEAQRYDHPNVLDMHVFVAVLQSSDRIFELLPANVGILLKAARARLQNGGCPSSNPGPLPLDTRVQEIFVRTEAEAREAGRVFIGIGDLLLAFLFFKDSEPATLLRDAGITRERVIEALLVPEIA